MSDLIPPVVQVSFAKTLYRPGETVIACVDVDNVADRSQVLGNWSVANTPRAERSSRFGDSQGSILVEDISVELRAVEKVDPSWIQIPKPGPGDTGTRGERTILQSRPTSLASNIVMDVGTGRSYGIRVPLPPVLPPSYRGTALKFAYYLRVSLTWKVPPLQETGFKDQDEQESTTSSSSRASVDSRRSNSRRSGRQFSTAPVDVRVPFRVCTLPHLSGLSAAAAAAAATPSASAPSRAAEPACIVPSSPLQVELEWRERQHHLFMQLSSTAATDGGDEDDDEDDQLQIASFSEPAHPAPEGAPRKPLVSAVSLGPPSQNGGAGLGAGKGGIQALRGSSSSLESEEDGWRRGSDGEGVWKEGQTEGELREGNGRLESAGGSLTRRVSSPLDMDLLSPREEESGAAAVTGDAEGAGGGEGGAGGSQAGGVPGEEGPEAAAGQAGRGAGEGVDHPAASAASPQGAFTDATAAPPLLPPPPPVRCKTYNIRMDDQILVRFTPHSPATTFCLGDSISGTLVFPLSKDGPRKCLEVSAFLEMHELVSATALHKSRRAALAPSQSSLLIPQLQLEHREATSNLLSSHFIFTIPPDASASFRTPAVAVRWQLRFEFLATVKQTSKNSRQKPHPSSPQSLLAAGGQTEKGEWTIPLTVHAPLPHTQTGDDTAGSGISRIATTASKGAIEAGSSMSSDRRGTRSGQLTASGSKGSGRRAGFNSGPLSRSAESLPSLLAAASSPSESPDTGLGSEKVTKKGGPSLSSSDLAGSRAQKA